MAVDRARIAEIRSRYEDMAPVMDERVTRLWAAGEAKALGRGGIAAVTEATGILGKRIRYGIRNLAQMQRLVGWQACVFGEGHRVLHLDGHRPRTTAVSIRSRGVRSPAAGLQIRVIVIR